MRPLAEIWRFETERFVVIVDALEEADWDMSWDETGDIEREVRSGHLVVFCARARVLLDGREIAADYLGQCIYDKPADFRDHIGSKGRWGSYFSSMVRNAVAEARAALCNVPKVRGRE